jgi:4-hydroxy-2-oxoglutarate aldolase
MKDHLEGLFVPLTTPFDPATGDVAAVALRENTRALLEAGVDGVVAAGSTGEAPLLTDPEARRSVGWLRDVVPEDRWLVAGAGRESTRAAISACRTAAEEGADAVLVRPPAYFCDAMTNRALADHFRHVADESPIPVLLYNMPKYTHVPLSDSLLASLVDHQNIVGAKDSSGDLKNFAAYREAAPDWAMFIGSGALFYSALELGAVGGILAVADFAAPTCVEIARAFTQGDRAEAGRAQERLTPLHKTIVGKFGPAGVKCAMDVVGLAGGKVRPPLQDLVAKDRDQVEKVLRTARLATA